MAKAYASNVIPAHIDDVWAVVRDFGGLPDWHPSIVDSVIEQNHVPAAVGCVRRLTLTDRGVVRERLLRLDDVDRCYSYNFVESSFAVRSYLCTIQLREITASEETFACWWADFDADASVEAELRDTFANGVFAPGLAALRERFG